MIIISQNKLFFLTEICKIHIILWIQEFGLSAFQQNFHFYFYSSLYGSYFNSETTKTVNWGKKKIFVAFSALNRGKHDEPSPQSDRRRQDGAPLRSGLCGQQKTCPLY